MCIVPYHFLHPFWSWIDVEKQPNEAKYTHNPVNWKKVWREDAHHQSAMDGGKYGAAVEYKQT